MSLFSKNRKVNGLIGYFGLKDWWLSEFNDEERKYIVETFQPLGSSGQALESGEISYTSQTAVALLQNLSGWFSKEKDRSIAYKLIEKAEELSKTEGSILDVHFLYGHKLSIYYKDRDLPGGLEKAIESCKQQIAISKKAAKEFLKEYDGSPLPSHKGYQQLAIIFEKQGKFTEAINLCKQAAEQGWAGDWEKRVARCNKKEKKA